MAKTIELAALDIFASEEVRANGRAVYYRDALEAIANEEHLPSCQWTTAFGGKDENGLPKSPTCSCGLRIAIAALAGTKIRVRSGNEVPF